MIIYVILGLGLVWNDLKYRKIPNNLLILMLLIGVVSKYLQGEELIGSLLVLLITFLLGFVAYQLGIFGAGDGKFIAISMFFFSSGPLLYMVLTIFLIGGVYALGVYLYRWGQHKSFKEALAKAKSETIPYALPIYFGSLVGYAIWG